MYLYTLVAPLRQFQLLKQQHLNRSLWVLPPFKTPIQQISAKPTFSQAAIAAPIVTTSGEICASASSQQQSKCLVDLNFQRENTHKNLHYPSNEHQELAKSCTKCNKSN